MANAKKAIVKYKDEKKRKEIRDYLDSLLQSRE